MQIRTRSEWVILGLTLAVLIFFAGYAAGHAGIHGQVTIETASALREAESVQTEPVEQAATPADKTLIDLNTATAEELQALPGIGEELAARIVAYRTENGDFLNIDELTNVDGIGEGKYDAIKDRITVQ